MAWLKEILEGALGISYVFFGLAALYFISSKHTHKSGCGITTVLHKALPLPLPPAMEVVGLHEESDRRCCVDVGADDTVYALKEKIVAGLDMEGLDVAGLKLRVRGHVANLGDHDQGDDTPISSTNVEAMQEILLVLPDVTKFVVRIDDAWVDGGFGS